MVTLGEMQISGMLTMLMLAIMLVLRVPRRIMHRPGFFRARWLTVGGTLLIAAQFFVQHRMGLRQMGVTQGVFMNLLLFIPASLLIGMAVLYVQRHGRVSLWEWMAGGVITAVAVVMLLVTVFFDGVPLQEESLLLRRVEYVGAGLYTLLQGYLSVLQFREYKRLQRAVDEYFDHERGDLLGWMGHSVVMLGVQALLVPFAIFSRGLLLVVFSFIFFFFFFYCVISLYSYGISEDARRVDEANEPGGDETQVVAADSALETSSASGMTGTNAALGLTEEQRLQVEHALAAWIAQGGARQHSLSLGIVARQMHVSVRLLQWWLRQSEYRKLAALMNHLRVEDAKRVLREHPDWSSESVADFCGFSSRQYFHQIFVQHTGTTPAKFQKGC